MARWCGVLIWFVVASACGRTSLTEDLLLDAQLASVPTSLPECTAVSAPSTPTLAHREQLWPRQCIELRYTPDAEAVARQVVAGLAQWVTPCSWLCFQPLRPFEPQAPNTFPGVLVLGDRSVLRPGDPNLTVEWSYDGRSATWTSINLRHRDGTSLTDGEVHRAIAALLGLVARQGVESSLDGLHAAPTQADLQSVCALYPRC